MPLPKTPTEQLHFIHNEHPPVVKVKRKLIEDLLGLFLLHQAAKERVQGGTPDFLAYLRDLPPKLSELLPLLKDPPFPKSTAPLREVLHLANVGYVPPADSVSLINDLWLLYIYWYIWPASRGLLSKEAGESLNFREPYEGFDGFLDLSLAKLAFKIGLKISDIRQWGKAKEAIVRLNLKKKCQADTKKMIIYSAFANVRKDFGDTLNRIVGRILKHLNKGGANMIGKTTIEKAIKGNSQLMGDCFREEIRGKRKRLTYIRNTGV
jgi:hypothetical protein